MGDEESQDSSSSDSSSQSSYDSTSTATAQDTTTSSDPSSTDQPATDAQNAPSPNEDKYTQAGTLYQSGDYAGAIRLMQDILNTATVGSNEWGRAAYGVVMCYDLLGSISKASYGDQSAEGMMGQIVSHLGGHPNAASYQQQLDTYSRGEHWTGDYLLY